MSKSEPMTAQRIHRCEYGFLHDPEGWICPRHKAPPKPERRFRRPTGPGNAELVALAILSGAKDGTEVCAWTLANHGRDFTKQNFRNGVAYLREKGLVEPGAKSPVLRLTAAGFAFVGGERSEAAE